MYLVNQAAHPGALHSKSLPVWRDWRVTFTTFCDTIDSLQGKDQFT